MESKGGFIESEDTPISEQDNTKHSNDLDKNIIDYLNEEITHIRNEKLEPGWTIWAIVATISSLIWLLFNELEKQQVHIETVLFLCLIVEYLLISISEIYGRFFRPKSAPSKIKFWPINFFARRRVDLIVYLARHIGVISITYLLQSKVDQGVNIVAYLFNIFWIGLILFELLYENYSESESIYFANHHANMRRLDLSIATTILIPGFLAWAYLKSAIDVHLLIDIADIRIVGLVFAILYLVRVWSRLQTRSPVLESLVEIRRDYRLGRIDTLTTKKRIDDAMFGLAFAEVTKKRVEMIIQHIESAETEIEGAASNLNTVGEYYRKVDNELSKSDKDKIKALNRAIFDHLKRFSGIMRHRTFVMFFRLLQMYDYYNRLLPDPNGLTNLNQISDRVNGISEHFMNTKLQWMQLLKLHEPKEFPKKWMRKLKTLKTKHISIIPLDKDDSNPIG